MLVNPIPKIRIKSCSDALLWYNKRIGDSFEIYEFEMPYTVDFQSASLQNILDKANMLWVRTGDELNSLNIVHPKDAEIIQEIDNVTRILRQM